MPQVQNGRYELSVFIDDMDIIASGCLFVSASLYESIYAHIPSCELEVVVPKQLMDQRSIVDGSKLRFEIQFNFEKGKPKESYTYRVYCIKRLTQEQEYINIKLDGLLDFYEGFTSSNKYNALATTGEIFNKIAQQNYLTAQIDTTDDKQLWIGGEKNVFNFMQYMSQRGWINDTSCMIWYLDRHRILVYKDLTSLIAQRSDDIYTFKQTDAPEKEKLTYGYTDCHAEINSGAENIYQGGYGMDDYYFNFLEYKQEQVSAKKAVAWSNLFNINKELSKGLNDTLCPIYVGNHHPHHALACVQNQRLLATYSTYTILDSQFFQPYRLGQIVNLDFTYARDPNLKVDALTGIRIIDSIRINITVSAITSKVELAMQGLNGRSLVQEVY